jgi:hypothetical protein
MSTLHVTVTADSPLSAGQIRDALTDFSPRRAELFPNVDESYVEARILGPTSAEVTEGSAVLGGIWERNRYDWSQPDMIRAQTVDSNTWAPGSTWIYRFRERPASGTVVELEVVRIPKNWRGRLVVLALRALGRRRFTGDLHTTLERIAGRSAGTG